MDGGLTLNPNWATYGLPTSGDVPAQMVSTSIESMDPVGAFGAKESVEDTQVSTVPAIVNAIHNAIGVWIRELPITPEKVLKALDEKRRGEGGG